MCTLVRTGRKDSSSPAPRSKHAGAGAWASTRVAGAEFAMLNTSADTGSEDPPSRACERPWPRGPPVGEDRQVEGTRRPACWWRNADRQEGRVAPEREHVGKREEETVTEHPLSTAR